MSKEKPIAYVEKYGGGFIGVLGILALNAYAALGGLLLHLDGRSRLHRLKQKPA